MNCTQCGQPALQFTISDTYLIRCPACAFCWMADDSVTRLRECFDAKTVRAFEATVRELKRKAKGASDAALFELVEELDRAEDLIFDEEEEKPVLFGLTAAELAKQVADLNLLLTDSSDPVAIEDQEATAAMLAKALAKRGGAA
jgi:hypothetical protein